MRFFREGMTDAGFELLPGDHPIIPVMLHDARRAAALADALLQEGRLRHRLLLPRRPQGQGPHPHPDLRDAHAAKSWRRAVAAFAEAGAPR